MMSAQLGCLSPGPGGSVTGGHSIILPLPVSEAGGRVPGGVAGANWCLWCLLNMCDYFVSQSLSFPVLAFAFFSLRW